MKTNDYFIKALFITIKIIYDMTMSYIVEHIIKNYV